ncbi:MAG: hypothetical protein MRERC_7c010 [Mycoplasmataceae bacterium RC_NB112A]|nr:MAG: hypothetical protein MRERC_7c010 [Mycoplasmataceae bacterium RC_NB112A]
MTINCKNSIMVNAQEWLDRSIQKKKGAKYQKSILMNLV